MAYMDGQMSASEALEFERSLSTDDQKRLNDEVRLESAICDSIAGEECCPEALWNSLALRMNNQVPVRRRLNVWQRRFVAAVAVVAVVSTSTAIYRQMFPQANTVEAIGLRIAEKSLAEFADHTEVPGTQKAMQQYLNDNNIGLKLVSAEFAKLDPIHPIEILGGCKGNCPQGSLLEIRLTCCDKPIKLLIAPEGSGGASLIRRSKRCGGVVSSRVTGGYVIALVGEVHGNINLLDLLQPIGGNVV